jgi:hypothetical protein
MKYRQEEWEEKRKTFPVPHAGNGSKGNGSRWLRWLKGSGHFPNPIPNQRQDASVLPFLRHDYSPPLQGSLQLLNTQRGKQKQVAPFCLPVFVT